MQTPFFMTFFYVSIIHQLTFNFFRSVQFFHITFNRCFVIFVDSRCVKMAPKSQFSSGMHVAFAMTGNRVEKTLRKAGLRKFIGEQWFFPTVEDGRDRRGSPPGPREGHPFFVEKCHLECWTSLLNRIMSKEMTLKGCYQVPNELGAA